VQKVSQRKEVELVRSRDSCHLVEEKERKNVYILGRVTPIVGRWMIIAKGSVILRKDKGKGRSRGESGSSEGKGGKLG